MVLEAKDGYGYTPLHRTVMSDLNGSSAAMVELLVASGADVNAEARGGLIGGTPLHMARTHPAIVKILEKAGAK